MFYYHVQGALVSKRNYSIIDVVSEQPENEIITLPSSVQM
jgi:hypothetical protein